MFYYDIHVNIPKEGFSVFIQSYKELAEDEAIEQAVFENKLDRDDSNYVDDVREMPEDEYMELGTEHAKS